MRRLAAALAMALSWSIGPMAPAGASEGALDVSRNGVTWVDSISDPLFDADLRWIPGDTRTASFFVRHRGGTPGHLVVDVIGSTAGGLLDSGDLHISARGGGGTWTEVNRPGTHRLLTVPGLASGSIEKVHVTVAFDRLSQNATQLSSTRLLFRITLTDTAATGNPNGNDDGMLPDTGGPSRWWLAVGAAALIVGGLALRATRRRVGSDHD